MLVKINGKQNEFSEAKKLSEIIAVMLPDEKGDILGCLSGGRVLELNEIIGSDVSLVPIRMENEEGKRMYERSLRFVFLMAVKRCFPYAKVRIEHSIGNGVYIVLKNVRLYPNDVLTLEETMKDIVKENLPFSKHEWTKEQAIQYFNDIGEEEKARLLSYRPYQYFNVYECGGMYEYFYGAMLPSTAHVPVFGLRSRAPGLVLLMPSQNNAGKLSEYVSSPKQMASFAQSNNWCKILECTSAADLNDLIKQNKLPPFIRVNEALHDKSLADIAEDIVNRAARAIFIAGPSSSGKTTFANRLSIHLMVNGLRPIIISLDDFYKNRIDLPIESDGEPDLEALDALDVAHFSKCVKGLLDGDEVLMPRFNFTKQRREEEGYLLRIKHNQPVIIEGIHGLNPKMHEAFNKKDLCKIYISELTCLNLDDHNRIRTTDARLLRRIVRDFQFRNTSPENTLKMWAKVRRGEDKWIFPYQENADIFFNSALHYELPILKGIAYKLLKSIPKSDPNYLIGNRLIKILNYLITVDDSILNEIPPLSILREFIGGNTLYINKEHG